MIYALFISLFVLLLMEYAGCREDCLYISLVSLVVYLFAMVLLIMNRRWEYHMSGYAAVVTFLCFFVMIIGEHLARNIYRYNSNVVRKSKKYEYDVLKYKYNFTIIFMSIVAILYIHSVLSLGHSAMSLYGMDGQTSVLGAYREMSVKNGSAVSSSVDLLMMVSECLAYLYMFLFINNFKKIRFLIPIMLYVVPISFSTARSEIIKLFIAFIVMYYLIRTRPSGNTARFIKLLFKVIIVGTFAFIMLGNLTKKSSLYSGVFENISMYIASSIPAFDKFLEEYKYTISNFGAESLWGINSLLRKFGVILFNTDNNYLPYTYLSYMHHQTNIYTFMRRPFYDFGLFGMLIVIFLISFFYTRFYIKIVNNRYRNNMFFTIFFSTIFYPVFWIFADFRFFDILSLTGLVKIILYWIITKKVLICKEYIDNDVGGKGIDDNEK